MKATGIVRRIDDLGRVVIPKEIRRTLRIREGDPLEIFTDREGEICKTLRGGSFTDVRPYRLYYRQRPDNSNCRRKKRPHVKAYT